MTRRLLPPILIILILLIATAARFYNLGTQSLWYDEGVAYGHSQRNLLEMIPRLQNNVHVPAYFGSLSLYENFVGSTEFGLRSYSALWSIISVAAVYALGKRLFHPIVGLSAALLVALNGFSVYYAQEARMYAMLAAIATLSMWAFAKWALLAIQPYPGEDSENPSMSRQLWQWGLAFALLNLVGEYTHVSYALVMISQGVMTLLMLGNMIDRAMGGKIPYRIVWRMLGIYVAVNLLSLLFFAPWIFTAISQVSAQPNISDPVPVVEMIRMMQGWFAFGITFEEGMGGMGVVTYFLLLFGLLRLTDERQYAWWVLLFPVVWVLTSSSTYLYLELFDRYLRFLLPAQIAYALWMGRGVWVLWEIVPRSIERRTGWQRTATLYLPKVAATVAILAFAWQQFMLLDDLYHPDPDHIENYQRDDYRSMVETIMNEAGEGDAIILSAPGLQEIFGYYYDGNLPVYPLPAGEDIQADTEEIINSHSRIYVVLYGNAEQDPDGIVISTLNNEAFPISGEWVGDVRFERYARPANFTETETVNVQFGEHITLESIALNRRTFSPNDAIQLQLEWSTDSQLDTRYKVFVQLLDSNGVLVAQRDSEPGGNQALTTLWEVGETVLDNHALAIPDLATGEYTLIIGLYDSSNPEIRLPVGESDFYSIGTITVE